MKSPEIFRFFYGADEKDFARRIIISPFLPIKYMRQFTGEGECFKGVMFEGILGEDVSYIRCGIGPSNVRDALLAFEDTDRQVYFVGSAGGFSALEIGDVIFVEEAADKEGVFSSNAQPDEEQFKKAGIKSGRVFSLDAILDGEEKLLREKETEGFCACELETAAFYRTAAQTGLKVQAFVYISDLPFKKGFWQQLSPEDAQAISRAKSLLLNTLTGRC